MDVMLFFLRTKPWSINDTASRSRAIILAVVFTFCACAVQAQERTVALTFDDLPAAGTSSAAEARAFNLSILDTQKDAGGTAFNYSRPFGASSTVAISSLYYANHRNAAGAAVGFGAQIGGAMAANALKEFWPDLLQKLSRRH